MTDLAWMLVLQIALLGVLDFMLPNRGTTGRRPPTFPPATGLPSEQTARRMIERAYSSTAYGENDGSGWR
jgi:hypothetical protein